MLKWNDSLKTGIIEIDEQHKHLFYTINKLETFKNNDEKIINQIFTELEAYIQHHFSTEEKYMRDTSYNYYHEHKTAHEEFKEKYFMIIPEIKESFLELRRTLVLFLENWMEYHYKTYDVKMAQHLRDNLL